MNRVSWGCSPKHRDDMERKRILAACYSFLIPIARFLLRSGVSFREFSDIARVAFVHVASEDYGIRGRPTNVSRVAAMTGIARKDVKRLRSLSQSYSEDPRAHLSPLGDVLQAWCTHPDYLNAEGAPCLLQFGGGGRSFEQLVQRSAGDVPAGALKVELLRFGAIVEHENGWLEVVRREIVPEDLDERLFTSLAFSLKALASTIAYNTDPNRGSPARIERFVQSGLLSRASRQRLQRIINTRVANFSEEMDDLFSSDDPPSGEVGRRIGVGIYFYEDPE